MNSAGSTNDYARGYQVLVSNTATDWATATPVASGTGAGASITVTFSTQTARYLRIVQTGAATSWWSIAELNVYGGAAPPPPAAPSGLTATATSSSNINLSWTASSTSGVTYDVFRGTSSTFTPSTSNQIAGAVGTLTYSDSGLSAATTYYYFVQASKGGVSSASSNQASATTSASSATQINCGTNTAVSPFVADVNFTGGSFATATANTIDLSAVTNPAPMAVYQTARKGTFSYTIGGFAPSSSHVVRLHFAEIWHGAAGLRSFNVSINGAQVLTNFDVFATAGAKFKANIQQFTANANASGNYLLQFTTVKDNGLINGIEIQ
jgi:hypothetical protein